MVIFVMFFVFGFQLMHTHNGTEWRQAHVETAPFYTNKEVDHLITDTEVRTVSHIVTLLNPIFI